MARTHQTQLEVVGSNASICCLQAVNITRRKTGEGKGARTAGSKQTHTTTGWLLLSSVQLIARTKCTKTHQRVWEESCRGGHLLFVLHHQCFDVHACFPDDINDVRPSPFFYWLSATRLCSLQGCIQLRIFVPTSRAHWQQWVQTLVDVLGIMGKIWQILPQCYKTKKEPVENVMFPPMVLMDVSFLVDI